MTHAPSTAAAPHAGVERLLDLLTAQRDRYGELHALSARQQQLIADGETEQLLSLLSERQHLVERLTAVNSDLAPLRSRMTEISDAAPEDQRQRLRSLVDEVQTLLESIIDRDEQDRRSLESARARVGDELKRTTAAPRALHAYRANGPVSTGTLPRPSTARFTDRRG